MTARSVVDWSSSASPVIVRAAERCGALEAAILVEDDTRRDQSCPRHVIGQPVRGRPVLRQAQHAR